MKENRTRELHRDDAIQMNIDFAMAMLHARHQGLETSFTLGALKDRTPLVPKHFSREQTDSGCGSSAAACEEANNGVRFIRAKSGAI